MRTTYKRDLHNAFIIVKTDNARTHFILDNHLLIFIVSGTLTERGARRKHNNYAALPEVTVTDRGFAPL